MRVYGGEVGRRPSEMLEMASVAPMAPRVKRERMDVVGVHCFGHLDGPKLRNLGCGLINDFFLAFNMRSRALLIQEGCLISGI